MKEMGIRFHRIDGEGGRKFYRIGGVLADSWVTPAGEKISAPIVHIHGEKPTYLDPVSVGDQQYVVQASRGLGLDGHGMYGWKAFTRPPQL